MNEEIIEEYIELKKNKQDTKTIFPFVLNEMKEYKKNTDENEIFIDLEDGKKYGISLEEHSIKGYGLNILWPASPHFTNKKDAIKAFKKIIKEEKLKSPKVWWQIWR